MCEYCEENYGLMICEAHQASARLSICGDELQLNCVTSSFIMDGCAVLKSAVLKINFCPMCGRELSDD